MREFPREGWRLTDRGSDHFNHLFLGRGDLVLGLSFPQVGAETEGLALAVRSGDFVIHEVLIATEVAGRYLAVREIRGVRPAYKVEDAGGSFRLRHIGSNTTVALLRP